MLSAALLLLCNSLFLSLHLTGSAGSFPKPLSAARERECLERCAAGDLEARNILVEHNLRLVAHIIKKYYTQSTDQEDLISIGTIGLIKAVNTFRPDKGIKLATYAARCIENEILMYFRGQKKLQGEVSLNEALDTGPEGDALYLGDVVGEEDTMLEELQSKEDPPSAASAAGPGADSSGGGCSAAALRPGRPFAPDTAAGGGPLRYQPQLCIPH